MTHVIEPPCPDDAAALGSLQLAVWLQTYPCEEAGIDEAWIREHRGSSATAEGIDQWRKFIESAERHPALSFCRIVRSGTEIVGFLCGVREEGMVTLGPMYVLNESQGRGIGDLMMREFLMWAGDAPMRLWVTDYNNRAIRFYQRYGFKVTGERQLWRGRLPNIRMVRDASLRSNQVRRD
ncbi:GNAT family N-acetyltransferase [Streptomyces sp. NPDC093707]|uniref:GNAT family N-acetyltransferase n=1 Tax=Streptomyces sp. NPDC093707 TaxID=3154984 RepID=UPI0034503309